MSKVDTGAVRELGAAAGEAISIFMLHPETSQETLDAGYPDPFAGYFVGRGGVLGDTEVLDNLRVLETELTGAGVLEPLLRAEGTTDVLVTAPDAVWVDDGAGLRRTALRFTDEAAVRRLAQRLAVAAGRRLDDAQPWVDGQLSGVGSGRFTVRLHAVLPPVAAAGTCLSLRVLRPATQDLAALAAAGAITPEAARLLADVITARLAFLVSGGTGAGKTTLLSAALGAVAPHERIVCVEDAPELAPPHPHLVRLVARTAKKAGVKGVKVAGALEIDTSKIGQVDGLTLVDALRSLHQAAGKPVALILTTATSVRLSAPTIFALNSRLSVSVTTTSSAPSTTCALVMM